MSKRRQGWKYDRVHPLGDMHREEYQEKINRLANTPSVRSRVAARRIVEGTHRKGRILNAR